MAPDSDNLLRSRLRTGSWLVLGGLLAFVLLGPTPAAEEAVWLRLLQLAQALLGAALLCALHWLKNPRRPLLVPLLGMAAIVLSMGAQGLALKDPLTPAVLLTVIAGATAALIPWGWRAQLFTAGTVAATILALTWLLQRDPAAEPTAVGAVLLIALALSVYIAFELERYRRGLERANRLLALLGRVQSQFMLDAEPGPAFSTLLGEILPATQSKYGWICEIRHADDGRPYVETRAVMKAAGQGGPGDHDSGQPGAESELAEPEALFAEVMARCGPVIANEPTGDARAKAVPPTRPAPTSFLGLPLFAGEKLNGLVAMANRPGGYDAAEVELLAPFTRTCAALIEAHRNTEKRRDGEEALRRRTALQELLSDISTRLLNLSRERIGGVIVEVAEDVGKALRADEARVVVLEECGDPRVHRWAADGAAATQSLPERSEWWLARLMNGGSVQLHSREDLPAGTAGIDLEAAGARAALSVPLFCSGTLLGSLTLWSRTERKWERDVVTTLQLVGKALAGAIERLHLEAALEERERHFRQLTESAPDVITIVDEQGNIEYVNPAVERVLGCTPAAALGKRAFAACEGEDVEKAVAALAAAIAKPFHTHSTELRVALAERGSRVLECALTALASESGRARVLVSARDVTSRKELEQAKDELVGTVSHELRTPLTSLQGFVELMLAREYDADRRREFLTIIHNETLRLGRLIDDVLDIQRCESGRVVDRVEPVAVGALIRDCVNALSGRTERHTIRVETGGNLPEIKADPDLLRQVVRNLLSNAVKFSPAGGDVHLGARLEGDEIVIWVRDRGIGIPAGAIPKLFDKFYRVDSGQTRRIGGTGLGLALVREIVQAHGGRVWVESELGAGSTFSFSLPVSRARERASTPVPIRGDEAARPKRLPARERPGQFDPGSRTETPAA